MALLTTITPARIATARSMAAPEPDSAEEQQWQLHIDDALMLIQARVDRLKVAEQTVSQDKLDYVVRQAVVAHLRHPDDATQVVVSVDDGQISRRYESASGQVEITDAWWELLGLTDTAGQAVGQALPRWGGMDDPDRAGARRGLRWERP